MTFQPPEELKQQKSHLNLAWILFWLGMGLSLLTRLIALDKFPIYFFSDEAIQTMSAYDLINRQFRDLDGNLFPVYFQNGQQFNLSLSVWLQLAIAWLPRSVWLTRALPALISLVFPFSVGLWAKDYLKRKQWWLAPYIISALPAWFLHSRTAFESSLGVSFYSLFLFFYLKYRLKDRKFLIPALLFGACAFYSYAPLQLVVGVSGLVLLVLDWRYHFSNKRSVISAIPVLILLVLPYLGFRYKHQEALGMQLHLLRSYWLSEIPLYQKMGVLSQKWLQGLDPRYWFLPNQVDLIRHQMKGIGHLPWFFFPAFTVGLVKSFSKIKNPAYGLILIAFLVGPLGAALVDVSITRVLVLNLPFALMILLGFDYAFELIKKPLRLRKAAAGGVTVLLVLFSAWMTWDAVRNGPVWYPDYTLYGMQWGGQQISEKIEQYLDDNPEAKLTLSPGWANNTDVIMRYFLGDPLPITIGSTMEFDLYPGEISSDQVFIIGFEEYDWLSKNPKFTDLEILDKLAYPDGNTGFFFVRFQYSDQAEQIFADEMLERSKPEQSEFDLLGQRVGISYSRLDLGTIAHIFDGNRATPLRTLEANPLEITIDFPDAVLLEQVKGLVGSPATEMLVGVTTESGEVLIFSEAVGAAEEVREVLVRFGKSISVTRLQIWVESLGQGEPTHVHLWELILE